jgi:hypothetical protein
LSEDDPVDEREEGINKAIADYRMALVKTKIQGTPEWLKGLQVAAITATIVSLQGELQAHRKARDSA